MPRYISFSMTTPQFLAGTKDVTRRMGWKTLKAGDDLIAAKKCMGLKAGEKVEVLGTIRIVSVRREPLEDITPEDVVREGFPDWSTERFIAFFCAGHSCQPEDIVTRIEFARVTP